ncbi:IS21 family transposase, partial [Heliobacterium undosum]
MDLTQRQRILRMVSQGIPISHIARTEDVDRKAIYRALAQPTKAPPQEAPSTLIAPYVPQIEEWIQKGFTAVWMYQELRRQHRFPGSYDTVKRYVATVRPPKPPESVIRFETPPGDQAQMDWAHFKLTDDNGRIHRFYAFVWTLSYSRWMDILWVPHCDIRTIIRCHEQVFSRHGGVPAEILYDRQSPVYQKQRKEEIVLNPIFEQFARHWGFEPVVAQARRGQTKGKVERPIRYIRGNFYPSVETFESLDKIQNDCDLWLQTCANIRLHRTTRER